MPRAWLALVTAFAACVGLALTWAGSGRAGTAELVPVKLGIPDMSKADRATLWQRVDEYATVDALQEFCGNKLNLPRRAWNAVVDCVETPSLRKVLSVFRAKKTEYMKAWETAHGEADKKKALCDSWKDKLVEYKKIIDGQIAEAANLCRACLFC